MFTHMWTMSTVQLTTLTKLPIFFLESCKMQFATTLLNQLQLKPRFPSFLIPNKLRGSIFICVLAEHFRIDVVFPRRRKYTRLTEWRTVNQTLINSSKYPTNSNFFYRTKDFRLPSFDEKSTQNQNLYGVLVSAMSIYPMEQTYRNPLSDCI